MLRDRQILWLCDHTAEDTPAGGAEITDSHILGAGTSMGYRINVCRPQHLTKDQIDAADLVIFSNCYEFPDTVRNLIINQKPYIVYSHDSSRWMQVFKRHPNMLAGSLLNVFLSPLHRDCFHSLMPSGVPTECIPPHLPINFRDLGYSRINRVMFAGNIHSGKGVFHISDYAIKHPGVYFDFYYNVAESGALRTLKGIPNCNLVGFVPKEEIFENYNKYKYFIHIPQCHEAFGRAVSEAFLCGCNLIVNKKIGAFSYGWNYKEFREKTLFSHYSFWETLEKYVS